MAPIVINIGRNNGVILPQDLLIPAGQFIQFGTMPNIIQLVTPQTEPMAPVKLEIPTEVVRAPSEESTTSRSPPKGRRPNVIIQAEPRKINFPKGIISSNLNQQSRKKAAKLGQNPQNQQRQKASVFSRLGEPVRRESVFNRLGVNSVQMKQKINIFTKNSFEPLNMVQKNASKAKLKKGVLWGTNTQEEVKPKHQSPSRRIYRALRAARRKGYVTYTSYAISHSEESQSQAQSQPQATNRPRTRSQRETREEGRGQGQESPTALNKGKETVQPHESSDEEEDEPVFIPKEGVNISLKRLEKNMEYKDREIRELHEKLDEMARLLATLTPPSAVRPEPVHWRQNPMAATQPAVQHPQSSQQPGSSTQTKGIDESLTRDQILHMMEDKVKGILAEEGVKKEAIPRGRPYPPEFDLVEFPKGYVIPKFQKFNGFGSAKQHVAHFKATCGNTGGNDALLMRQFVNSLTSVAFDWYINLPDNTVKSFAQLELMFYQRFPGADEKITVADLASTKRRKEESIIAYITRWRNLSINCEQELEQSQAVSLVLRNIDNWMAPFLCTAGVKTFQDLITHVSRLEHTNP